MFSNPYNFGNANYIPQGTGYQYNGGQPAAAQKINNVLTAEEIQKLVQRDNQLVLQLTEREVLRAKCNHRRADGLDDAIVEDPITGVSRCTICGYEFRPLDIETSPEAIQDATDNILDVLQTVKMIYTTIPADVAAEYFQIIPLIEKIPELFKFAVKDYTKRLQYNPYMYNNRNMSTMSLFNMLCGGPMMGQGFVPNVDPNVQAQQQMIYNQPMYNPAFAANAAPYNAAGYGAPMSNGFGIPNPAAPGYAPQTAGYQFNPQQPAPAAAPVADATTNTATATVTDTFKA